MFSTTKRTARGSVTSPVWSGDLSALRDLVRRVEEVASYARMQMLGSLDSTLETRRAKFLSEHAYIRDDSDRERRWRQKEQEERAEIDRATRVALVARQRRWSLEHSGSPAEVLSEIDPKDVSRVRVTFGQFSMASVEAYEFALDLDNRGATAEFVGPDTNFVDLAATKLRNELKQARPWFGWVRRGWAVWVLYLPAAIASLYVWDWARSAGVASAVTLQFLFLAIVGTGTYMLARWTVPAFELASITQMANSRRRMKAMTSALVWLVGTVGLPLLLNQLTSTSS